MCNILKTAHRRAKGTKIWDFIVSMLVTREFRLYIFLAICQNLKNLWHFEIFVNTEPYGAGTYKTLLLLQFSSDLGQTL